MNRLHRRRHPLAWMLALGMVGLSLVSCSLPTNPVQDEQTVSGAVIVERYLADQKARRQGPLHWAVDGVLDLETPEQERRNRIDLLGSGWERVRLRVYGPFRQVAGELLARGDRVRWVDPEKHAVIEVPASAAGLDHLIGVPIPPERLFQVIMARASRLASTGPFPLDPSGAVIVKTRDREQLRLDPTQGRLLERIGKAGSGTPYRVVYTWPDSSPKGDGEGDGVIMPERILITLEKPKVRLEFILNTWRFPANGLAEGAFDQATRSGFSLSRPLEPGP
ncbi:MAG: hypothetical protein HQL98_12410 [Magnetococcales bacterium]|nr:hypothetical protein [Magnetococcales bacterium]